MEKKTVTYRIMETKNQGLDEVMEITPGKCPCKVCGHTEMEECDKNNCQCCSSACT